MGDPAQENTPLQKPKLEALMLEMLAEQHQLDLNVASTSQFLKFVLSLANENLGVIRTQLEKIRDLAIAIDECNCA